MNIAHTLYGLDTFYVVFELTLDALKELKDAHAFLQGSTAAAVEFSVDLQFVRPQSPKDLETWPASSFADFDKLQLSVPLCTDSEQLDDDDDDGPLLPSEYVDTLVVTKYGEVRLVLNYETAEGGGDLIEGESISLEALETLLSSEAQEPTLKPEAPAHLPGPAPHEADTNRILDALDISVKKNDVCSAIVHAKDLVAALDAGAALPERWR